MDLEGEPASYDLSLDEIIRNAKAKQMAEEQAKEGISPFFRQNQPLGQYNRRPRQNFQKDYSRSSFLNNFAKKRVAKARRTLDLRQKLIHMRANKSGLDLRYKIVANMIAKLRQQSRTFQNNPRFHPYQYVSRLNGLGHQGGTISQSGMSRSTVSRIEKLVGRLPSWIKNNQAASQMVARVPQNNYKQQLSAAGPMRSYPRPVPICQHQCYPGVRNNIYGSHPSLNESFCSTYAADEMPPLAYDPHPQNDEMPNLTYEAPPRARTLSAGINSHIDPRDIQYVVRQDIQGDCDNAEQVPRLRSQSLNERFKKY